MGSRNAVPQSTTQAAAQWSIPTQTGVQASYLADYSSYLQAYANSAAAISSQAGQSLICKLRTQRQRQRSIRPPQWRLLLSPPSKRFSRELGHGWWSDNASQLLAWVATSRYVAQLQQAAQIKIAEAAQTMEPIRRAEAAESGAKMHLARLVGMDVNNLRQMGLRSAARVLRLRRWQIA